jgi:hypothetical protein
LPHQTAESDETFDTDGKKEAEHIKTCIITARKTLIQHTHPSIDYYSAEKRPAQLLSSVS